MKRSGFDILVSAVCGFNAVGWTGAALYQIVRYDAATPRVFQFAVIFLLVYAIDIAIRAKDAATR